MNRKFWAGLGKCFVLCICTAMLGCGESVKDSKKNLVPVTGQVTLDGKPLPRGTVSFVSTDGPGKAFTGPIDSNGNYSLAYSPSSKGAEPGNYAVSINAVDGEAKMGDGGTVEEAKSLIPSKYNATSTSGLTATVDKSGKPINFELKSN